MKRILAVTMAASLALAGCGTASQPKRDEVAALQACASLPISPTETLEVIVQAHHDCMINQYHIQEVDQAHQRFLAQQQGEDAATMMLLGGTAILNGWNASRYQQPLVVEPQIYSPVYQASPYSAPISPAPTPGWSPLVTGFPAPGWSPLVIGR
jgi:hypothetical protein